VNQQFPIITRPASSRTGQLQRIDQSNAIFARPRTVRESRLARAAQFFWTVTLALGVGFIAHGIVKGLPYFLAMYGVR
jgi:hypothetical protein